MNELKPSDNGWMRVSAPAKVNLMLSVHGRREDGFHDLTSIIAALEFGDELEVCMNDLEADTLTCDDEGVPLDDSNLVLQAAHCFREDSGRSEFFDFRLTKRIPVGAGLGGGSSDAVAALKAMDTLLGTRMGSEELRAIAARLGSDCPFFVDETPAVMRGRGELIEPLDRSISSRLTGRKIVLFRPSFGIHTGWAYGQLVKQPELYEDLATAEKRLGAFAEGGGLDDLLHNVFEGVVGRKFLAIPCLLEKLRSLGALCMMSGSGSACFALADDDGLAKRINEISRQCWGDRIFWVETSIC